MEKKGSLSQRRRVNRKTVAPNPKRDETMSPEARRKMIEESAYYRFERRAGGNGGDHLEDWLQAEAEIDAMLNAS
jgi:Protein of unknown function (DUF2934)